MHSWVLLPAKLSAYFGSLATAINALVELVELDDFAPELTQAVAFLFLRLPLHKQKVRRVGDGIEPVEDGGVGGDFRRVQGVAVKIDQEDLF